MIFFDNASTTKPLKEVVEEVTYVNTELYFNPSSLYGKSVEVQNLINEKRKKIVSLLGGSFFDNFIFLSGATEANNFAIRGALKKGGKLVTTLAEHTSTYNLAKQLQNEGYEVEFLGLKQDGTVDESDLLSKLQNASIVSIMHVCNENGSINDIKKLCSIVKNYNRNIIFHCDGVQAFGKIALNVTNLGVDLYTISGHKIHAPKGIGGIYIKQGLKLKPIFSGGDQENGYRAGTENVSGIFALYTASQIAIDNLKNNYEHVNGLNNYLKNKLQSLSNIITITSHDNSSPYIITLSAIGVKSETLLHLLESENILVGNGSACSSKYSNNRVLQATGLEKKLIDSSIRVSFSHLNTTQELDTFVEKLNLVVTNYLNTINKK